MNPVYAFAPGLNHLPYLRPIINSIIRNCSEESPHFCILLPCKQARLAIDADCTFKIAHDSDVRLCSEMYYQEARADIPPFAAYAQLMIPRYFSEYHKILYIEVDQVVQKDLHFLWQTVYKNDVKLGAVPYFDGRTGQVFSEIDDEFFRAAKPKSKYFNTGVFLFDTDYWITNRIEEKCFEYVRKQKDSGGQVYRFYAQGAMNRALASEITSLDHAFNWAGLGYMHDIPPKLLDEATILHWNGGRKPWMEDGLYRSRYVKASGFSVSDIRKLAEESSGLEPSRKRRLARYAKALRSIIAR